MPTANQTCSIRAIPDYGPIFGLDDILVDFKVRNISGMYYDGWCSFGNMHKCPFEFSTCKTTGNYLCGDWTYFLEDIEVFYLEIYN